MLTCLDSSINLEQLAALGDGEAHFIRNAGGRASEHAVRSLVACYELLGAREWFVVHQGHCGMEPPSGVRVEKQSRGSSGIPEGFRSRAEEPALD